MNAYGMELGNFFDWWLRDSIKPGATYTQNQAFRLPRLVEVLEYSSITLPKDWSEPAYLSVDGIAS